MMVIVFLLNIGYNFKSKYDAIYLITASLRCNGENDCPDESDEQNCHTLYWEGGNKDAYSEAIPPRPLDEDVHPKLLGIIKSLTCFLIKLFHPYFSVHKCDSEGSDSYQ